MKKVRVWTDRKSHLFRVGKLPNAGDDVSPAKAAAILGVDVADVYELINDGVLAVRLTPRGQPMVDAKSLATFASELQPLDIVIDGDEIEVKVKAEDKAAEGEAKEKTPRRKGKKAEVEEAVEQVEEKPVEEVEEVEDEADVMLGECSECGAELAIDPGIVKFRCPQCGAVLEVDEAEEEKNPSPLHLRLWKR